LFIDESRHGVTLYPKTKQIASLLWRSVLVCPSWNHDNGSKREKGVDGEYPSSVIS
jgi:hypothetical protein